MKHVCIITSIHPYNDKRIFFKEALSLVNIGYQVDIIAPAPFKNEVLMGINIIGIPKLRSKLQIPLNWYRIFKIIFNPKYLLFHFHDPDLLILGILLKILTKKTVIYDVHEHYPDRIFIKNKWIPKIIVRTIRNLLILIENISSRIVQNIIVVEDSQYNRFNKMKCNVLILYNYARLSNFNEPVYSYEKYSRNVVIHTGTLSVARGSLFFLDILKKIKAEKLRVKFKFVRRFLSSEEENLLNNYLLAENMLGDFSFINSVSSDKISKIIREGDIALSFLLPVGQYLKAIPTKLFEYMACGIPIIAEESPYNEIFIKNNNCGILIKHNDIDGFIQAIKSLLKNTDKKIKLGKNGRRAFVEKYNWEIQEGKLASFYNNLVIK